MPTGRLSAKSLSGKSSVFSKTIEEGRKNTNSTVSIISEIESCSFRALNTSETRLHISQSEPIRPILWLDNHEIEQIHRIVQIPLRHRDPEIETAPVEEVQAESLSASEKTALLESSKCNNYLSADVVEYDWDAIASRLAQLRETTDCRNICDRSQVCREFNVILQTRQPLWIELTKLKQLDVEILSLRSSFLNPQTSEYDLRCNRKLEWQARLGAIGIDEWRSNKIVEERKKLVDEIRQFFPEDEMSTILEGSEGVELCKQCYMHLKIALFAGAAIDIDIMPDTDCPDQSESDSIRSDDFVELSLMAEISLLLELKKLILDRDKLEHRIFTALEAKAPFKPGPVGESPIHVCLLLGLKDTGKRMMERFYTTPELSSTEYTSDLAPWTRSDRVTKWEDGLYTGQTCLHMAIAQEDAELVRYLLDRRISIMSRARGVFFQPRWMRLPIYKLDLLRAMRERWEVLKEDRQDPLLGTGRISFWQAMGLRFEGGDDQNFTLWQLLKAWLWTLIAVGDPSVTVVCFVNDESRCYYGELPLSFAASVGDVRICNCLYTYQRMRLQSGTGWATEGERRERERQLHLRAAWGGGSRVPTDMSLFVNAVDSFGNTAMHMAVMYGRRAVVDWLMTTPEGRESLELINFDGFTPLTLAARHGNVELFRHILYEYQSEIVWVYGKCHTSAFHRLWCMCIFASFIVARNCIDALGNAAHQAPACQDVANPAPVAAYWQVKMRVTDLYQVDTFRLWRRDGCGDDDLEPAPVAWVWPPDDEAWSRALQVARRSATSWMRRTLGLFKGATKVWQSMLHQTGDFHLKGEGLHGCQHWRSALEIIVHYEVQAFAKDPLFNKIINEKWQRFGCRLYLKWTVAPFAVLVAWFTAFVCVRTTQVRTEWERAPPMVADNQTHWIVEDRMVKARCSADLAGSVQALWLSAEQDVWQATSLGLQAGLAIVWAGWLVATGWTRRKLKLSDLDVNDDSIYDLYEIQMFVFKNLHFLLSVSCGTTLFLAGACRVICWTTAEMNFLALSSIILFTNTLIVLLPFQYIGALVITVYKMLIGDITRFLVVYLLLFCGFSLGTCLICQRSSNMEELEGEDEVGKMFLHLAFVSLGDSLGEVMGVYDNTRSPALTLLFYFVWVIVSLVLLLNLLVAMMGKTFMDEMEDTHRIWVFPFASMVLRYEKMLDKRQRIKYRHGREASWNEGSCGVYHDSSSEGASRRISRGLDGSPEAAAAAAVARMRERYYETRIENDEGWREAVPGSVE